MAVDQYGYEEDGSVIDGIKEIKELLKGKGEQKTENDGSGMKEDIKDIRSSVGTIGKICSFTIIFVFVMLMMKSCSVVRISDEQINQIVSKTKIAVMEDINAKQETKK